MKRSANAPTLIATLALGIVGASCAVDFPDYELEGGGASSGGAGGADTLLANGAPCSSPDECANGHCLANEAGPGNVCCNTQCEPTAPESCGTTGMCTPDGASCALHPVGTICGETTCQDGVLSTDRCDGGSCTPGAVDESFEGTLRYQIKLSENGNNPQPGIMAKRCDADDPQCAAPLEDVSVLQTGDISVGVPADFFGYLDLSGGGYKPTLVYLGPPNHLPTPIERVPVFNLQLFNLLLASVGLDQEDPKRGHLFILGADCDMEPAAGLTLTASTADNDSERFYYSSSGAVSQSALETSELGIGGFINVPAGEVIVKAFRAENTSTPMGEAAVTIRPQTITMIRLGPTP